MVSIFLSGVKTAEFFIKKKSLIRMVTLGTSSLTKFKINGNMKILLLLGHMLMTLMPIHWVSHNSIQIRENHSNFIFKIKCLIRQ